MPSRNKSPLPIRILRTQFFVLIAGLAPLLALWNQNLGQIQSKVVIRPIIFTALFILLVIAVWFLVSKSLEKTALLASLTILFCFTYGHAYNLLEKNPFLGFSIGFIKLFFAYLIVFVLLTFLVFRIKRFPKNLFLYLNLMAGFLLVLNLFPILVYQIKLVKPNPQPPAAQNRPQVAESDQRDIYYIVLDAYARQDVLQKVIGYDNTAFLSALKDRGFYIPDCAFSNYDVTLSTISSVLNYDLLPNLGVAEENIGKDSAENLNLILNNKVRNYFKPFGYLFVTGRGYSSFNDILDSDLYLSYFADARGADDLSQNRFSSLYLNTTVIRVFSEMYKNNPEKFSRLPFWLALDRETNPELKESSFWYYQNNYVFDSLETIPEKKGAYLVYAHLNSPHAPYVYRSDGSFRYPLDTHDEKILYADTLTYLNKRVLQMVDKILANSKTPPIIIIQADHSIHLMTAGLDKHKILSAYYLPGDLISPPYPTITPVNNFRLIIKNYFDPTMELLPDMLYVKYLNTYELVPSSCDLKP